MKKKILFIIPWLPFPLKTGGHQALFNGIYVAKDDFDVHLAYQVGNDGAYLEHEKQFMELIPNVKLHPLFSNSRISVLYRIISRIIQTLKKFILTRHGKDKKSEMCANWVSSISPLHEIWLEHISMLCKKFHFDIIQVEMPWLVSQILTLPHDPNVKKIFIHHELGFVRRELEQSLFVDNEYVNACRLFSDIAEIGMLNMFDAVVTLSQVDKEKLLSHGVTIPVYSSFATVKQQNNNSIYLSNGKLLSFVGSDSHIPNFIGITWFLTTCWNKLKVIDPSYRLKIIGKWDKNHIQQYTKSYPGIEFMGFVDNLDEAIKGSIMIVPINIGSGIRMKILEACSIGVPFVSTSVGAEGLPVVNGRHCYIADTPDDFIDSLVRMQKTEVQEEFIIQARKMVGECYSLEALRVNRLDIYNDILV